MIFYPLFSPHLSSSHSCVYVNELLVCPSFFFSFLTLFTPSKHFLFLLCSCLSQPSFTFPHPFSYFLSPSLHPSINRLIHPSFSLSPLHRPTLTTDTPLSPIFLISSLLPPQKWEPTLSSSLLFSHSALTPTPYWPHTHPHFWLWASDTHLLAPPFNKSLKDPQMCAPLISISKKNHLPPPINNLYTHTHLSASQLFFFFSWDKTKKTCWPQQIWLISSFKGERWTVEATEDSPS